MSRVPRALMKFSLCGAFLLPETKRLQLELKQDGEDGEVSAQFSVFNAVDKDGDDTPRGAFGKQDIRIAAWGHNWGVNAVGRGAIRETRDAAVMDGKFFLDTTGGLDAYRTVKGLGELQEWSYGYDVDEYSLRQPKDGENTPRYDGMVRVLHKLTVHEVSPVMIGAGTDTRTLRLKGLQATGALLLLRKVREGAELSESEIEQLAELFDAPMVDVGKAVSATKEPAPTPEPADPAPDPDPAPQADPDPEPTNAEAQKLFLEYQKTLALAPRRTV